MCNAMHSTCSARHDSTVNLPCPAVQVDVHSFTLHIHSRRTLHSTVLHTASNYMIRLILWCQGTRRLLYSWYAIVIWSFLAYLCNSTSLTAHRISSTCGTKSVKAHFGLPMQAGHDVHRRIVPGLRAARHHGCLWMLCTHLGGAWLGLELHSCALAAGHHDCCHCKAIASSALALLECDELQHAVYVVLTVSIAIALLSCHHQHSCTC